jgi:hypothetical protein
MVRENDLIRKYKNRLSREFGVAPIQTVSPRILSQEYGEFKKSFLPKHHNLYEKGCAIAASIVKVKPDKKRAIELQEAINITHMDITPQGAMSFAVLVPVFIMIFGGLFGFFIFQSIPAAAIFAMGGLAMMIPLQKFPDFLANNWRLKSSNQMVQCIFYVVTYMRHTSNLERAIEFTSNHVGPPLSLDLKKVLWDVETAKFDSIKDSLDNYLKTWEKWNREFIESFHLIQGSLYEPSESRRLDSLDKALSVILTETYEKMLHYAHNLQSPVTMLHMLGVILPILGLVILPLVVSFMTDKTSPGQIALVIAAIYNVLLPVGVYYLSKIVLSRRPTGYGQADITETLGLSKFKYMLIKVGKSELKIPPIMIASTVFFILLIVGVSPLLLHSVGFVDFTFYKDGTFSFLGYICPEGNQCLEETRIGPYGLGAAVMSLFVTLAVGLGIGLYFKLRSKNVLKIREKTKQLEQEFASALFQLGNRLGDNIPVEIAFSQVAGVMQGTVSGEFFMLATQNITKLGMSVERAIFDKKNGALVSFPSNVIESSMKVLIESSKKGPKIAAQALISMSRYIKEIHRVDERLKDLLADIISSMKGQIKFLTPAIAGIVIGITSMITTILNRLSSQITSFTQGGTDLAAQGGAGGFVSLFGNGMPTYYFQVIVGIYVVQITYILTILSNGIENGSDKLNERFLLGRNTINATLLYVVISLTVMVMFNLIAGQIMNTTLGV